MLSGAELGVEYRETLAPAMLLDLVRSLRGGGTIAGPERPNSTVRYGQARRGQGCAVTELIDEWRTLHGAILTVVQSHLLSIDLSWLIPDLIRLSDDLQQHLVMAVDSYAAR